MIAVVVAAIVSGVMSALVIVVITAATVAPAMASVTSSHGWHCCRRRPRRGFRRRCRRTRCGRRWACRCRRTRTGGGSGGRRGRRRRRLRLDRSDEQGRRRSFDRRRCADRGSRCRRDRRRSGFVRPANAGAGGRGFDRHGRHRRGFASASEERSQRGLRAQVGAVSVGHRHQRERDDERADGNHQRDGPSKPTVELPLVHSSAPTPRPGSQSGSAPCFGSPARDLEPNRTIFRVRSYGMPKDPEPGGPATTAEPANPRAPGRCGATPESPTRARTRSA
ncbi:MAG: hypothetical protein JWM72_3788 [Actinomycetia bacterium]|nr:hypothetical protein [Actinomycetes bacterium]